MTGIEKARWGVFRYLLSEKKPLVLLTVVAWFLHELIRQEFSIFHYDFSTFVLLAILAVAIFMGLLEIFYIREREFSKFNFKSDKYPDPLWINVNPNKAGVVEFGKDELIVTGIDIPVFCSSSLEPGRSPKLTHSCSRTVIHPRRQD